MPQCKNKFAIGVVGGKTVVYLVGIDENTVVFIQVNKLTVYTVHHMPAYWHDYFYSIMPVVKHPEARVVR